MTNHSLIGANARTHAKIAFMALAVSAAFVALVSLLLGGLILRRRGVYFSLLTLGRTVREVYSLEYGEDTLEVRDDAGAGGHDERIGDRNVDGPEFNLCEGRSGHRAGR